ncbi:MAG: hypothetical protein BCS36_03970 [Desulfovibrio sp. MES5]|uniref:hypothetical protein n=1 Tax=Desulfovibrio sp. MES5 TaxID=1899016 RepID=UPI000B9CC0F0|nr:hypothetical protein [Desulfovibrio sp. MES5]OXS29934.1 MAG: hypothetical protein BCS36_03970 [Desulfovibrio sp. MES5]
MSEFNNNIETVSAVLDILQNNALPAQKPVLRLLGDHLRLLVRCMDEEALCPPHMPSGTPTPGTSRLAAFPPVTDASRLAESSHMAAADGTARRFQEVGHVRQ